MLPPIDEIVANFELIDDWEERYRYLTTRFPALALRFPLQHIASFLGIRRETLSRIRTKASSRR